MAKGRHESAFGLTPGDAGLREQLELLEEAAENVRHGLCMFDEDGRIAYCNRRYAEAIGLPTEQVVPGVSGRRLIELSVKAGHHPPGMPLENLEAEFWNNLETGDAPLRHFHRLGRTYLIRSGRTASGKLVATFEDVSGELEAESALRQRETGLSAMLDAMPDCVKIFDAKAQLLYINSKGLDLLEAPDLAALAASGHVPIPPEYMSECIDVHQRVIAGESVVWSYEIIGMKGGRRHVEAHAVPYRMPDGAPAHMSITRDITARRQAEEDIRRSEERLRLVQDAAGLADFENDCGQVTTCSDRFFDQVGLPKGDGTITLGQWMDLIHPDDRGRIEQEMLEALEDAEIYSTEYRIVRADTGEVRWVCCRTKLLRDESGKPIKTIGAHRDITARKEREEALRRSEERLRLVKEATQLADFDSGEDGVAHVSDALVEQMGLPAGTTDLSFERLLEFVHPDDRQQFQQDVDAAVFGPAPLYEGEFRIIHGVTGEVRWIHSRTKMERDKDGKVIRTIGAHLDITQRKVAEAALRESEERFRLAAEAAGLGVWDYDAARDRREWSGRLREIFGFSPDAPARLEAALACVCPEDRKRFEEALESLKSSGRERFESPFRITPADGGPERWLCFNGWRAQNSDNLSQRIIVTVRDVTDEKTAEDRIRWSASHDPLTRLANRALFQEELDLAIRVARQDDASVGVLVLDLDHFKQINDSLGHDVGDALLKMVADRLRSTIRKSDTVARLGGDEFAIVVPRLGGRDDLVRLSQAIQDRMRAPFVHEGRMFDCRVSSGASMYPDHGGSPREVLKNADLALYAAKSAGRATLTIYEPALRQVMQRQINMVSLARDAISDDRIIPYYQPKLDLVSGRVHGFEALLRWRTPAGRIGQPAGLSAAFEDLEVAAALSDRMIDRVIADMRGWLDRGIDFQHVAVNASAAEFRRDNFAERVLESLRRSAIPPRCFQIEVTETVFLGRGAESVHRALALLNSRGVKIALDDFGTGYASLRHLKQFPVDIIKIDQSFVRDMEADPGDEAIVRAVINLGRSLGIHVVAEGIESISQAERLLRLGCDYGQGFLFSKAVPPSRVPSLVSHWQGMGAETWDRSGSGELRLVASSA